MGLYSHTFVQLKMVSGTDKFDLGHKCGSDVVVTLYDVILVSMVDMRGIQLQSVHTGAA